MEVALPAVDPPDPGIAPTESEALSLGAVEVGDSGDPVDRSSPLEQLLSARVTATPTPR
jgi:hypothetical protein